MYYYGTHKMIYMIEHSYGKYMVNSHIIPMIFSKYFMETWRVPPFASKRDYSDLGVTFIKNK